MQKPTRKNSHKERIFSLPQNKIDFGYQTEHQGKTHEPLPKSIRNRIKQRMPMTAQQARVPLKKADGWHLSDDGKMIYREYVMKDFMASIDLINHIARVAESLEHHPDIHLTGYRKLRIELTTHDISGLSADDFIAANKINHLPLELKRAF